MEQDKTTHLAMNSIYTQAPRLTAKEQEIIEQHLLLVFVAGWEQGFRDRFLANCRPIKLIKNEKEIQKFPSIKIASNITKVSIRTISRSLLNHTRVCKDGSRWAYLDEGDCESPGNYP